MLCFMNCNKSKIFKYRYASLEKGFHLVNVVSLSPHRLNGKQCQTGTDLTRNVFTQSKSHLK